jgi:hypothetical protein
MIFYILVGLIAVVALVALVSDHRADAQSYSGGGAISCACNASQCCCAQVGSQHPIMYCER